ncbi:MAG TPA: thioredoxin [Burkholderiales bacterium]|jgi:putative thioredoxin|nr:thioredoxin [Burkholderiales bacterium]
MTPQPNAPAATTSNATTDVTTATFETEVIEASMHQPVVIDFWAPWCGPCRALTPILEKLAGEYAGKVKVVKINSDENQEIAAAFRVRSIPYVAALVGGQLADQFLGVQPEPQIRAFFDKVLGMFAQAMPEAAAALENQAPPAAPLTPADAKRQEAAYKVQNGDLDGAIDALKAALALDPGSMGARMDLAELELAADRFDAAKQHLEMVELKPEAREDAARLESLKARIVTLEAVKDLPATEELLAKVNANPKDAQARHDLAQALIAEGDFEQALDHLLEIVITNRKWNEEAARKAMLNVFAMLGGNEQFADLVSAYRRRLATALN